MKKKKPGPNIFTYKKHHSSGYKKGGWNWEGLNVDEMVGQLLASEGFTELEEVAYVDPQEIATIEGFDEDTASELQARAKEFLEKQEQELDATIKTSTRIATWPMTMTSSVWCEACYNKCS